MISLLKKKPYFNNEEQQHIVSTIREAELQTSGEIRLFIESRCKSGDALQRATELFSKLNMHQTAQRNAVILYIAMKDKKLAVFGDQGIHNIVTDTYWNETVQSLTQNFLAEKYVDGIINAIKDIAEKLRIHFPYLSTTDKNELPDDIVFGD